MIQYNKKYCEGIFMANSEEILEIEYYLRYLVSKCNKTINGLCAEHGDTQKKVYNNLLERFCYGDVSSNPKLERIRYLIETKKANNNIRPYGFFDLNTLLAYYKYLKNIIDYSRNGDMSVSMAVDNASRDLIKSRVPTLENGFYDINNPINLRMINGEHIPLKRMSTEKFKRIYDEYHCRELLQEFITERANSIQSKRDVVEEQDHSSSEQIINYVKEKKVKKSSQQKSQENLIISSISYGGILFNVISSEYQHLHTDKFLPTYLIEGVSVDGKYKLQAVCDILNGTVYEGELINVLTRENVPGFNAQVVELNLDSKTASKSKEMGEM